MGICGCVGHETQPPFKDIGCGLCPMLVADYNWLANAPGVPSISIHDETYCKDDINMDIMEQLR